VHQPLNPKILWNQHIFQAIFPSKSPTDEKAGWHFSSTYGTISSKAGTITELKVNL